MDEITHALDWLNGTTPERAYDSDELELRRRCLMTGSTGYADTLQQAFSQALVSVNEPGELGTGWQINVLALQGVKLPSGIVGTFAPDPNAKGLQLPRAVINASPGSPNYCYKLRVSYGTGNVSEQAWLDYPYGGGTFEVYASHVDVYLESITFGLGSGSGNAYDLAPKAGAFITKARRNKALLLPTFTNVPVTVGASSLAAFFAPPRAVGYRTFTADANAWGPSVPTDVQVPAAVGVQVLSQGTGVLQSIVVTATGTTNLTFTDGGNVIAVVPSTATVGQIFLVNQAFQVGLVANRATTTPAVAVTYGPAPGLTSMAALITYQGLYDGTVLQRDGQAISPYSLEDTWFPMNPRATAVFVGHTDQQNAHILGVQFVLDLG